MSEFIRVPADSTGKRIRHTRRIELIVSSILVDIDTIEIDTVITGATSGVTAYFKGSSLLEGSTIVTVSSPSGDFTAGELLEISAATAFTLDSYTDVYIQNQVITDSNDPEHALRIDRNGNAYTRFREGEPIFDAFGNAQGSGLSIIKQYTFLYGDTSPTDYWDYTTGTATVTGSASTSQLILSVDNVSGSLVKRTSQQYFPYSPGEGNQALFTTKFGDSGKSGNIKRFGIYDDDDGIYIEQSGSVLSVNLRNSVAGATAETKVVQSDWNGEQLTNSAIDSYVLDATKYQVYWIDFQWLGAGKVRIGTYSPAGERITIHTIKNANNIVTPYMKRGTLPWRAEIFNESNTSGASDLSLICVAVLRQSDKLALRGTVYEQHSSGSTLPVSGSGWTPLMTYRPKATYNGSTNRTIIIPMNFETFVDGDAIEFHTFLNPTLTGSTYTETKGAWDIDIDATSFTGGSNRNMLYIPAGVNNRDVDDTNLEYAISNTAQGIPLPITIAARCIKPTGTADVSLLTRWREVH